MEISLFALGPKVAYGLTSEIVSFHFNLDPKNKCRFGRYTLCGSDVSFSKWP